MLQGIYKDGSGGAPALGRTLAAGPGTSADQYVYDAIVRPQDFVPEDLRSSGFMPQVEMSAQDASDVLAFVMQAPMV